MPTKVGKEYLAALQDPDPVMQVIMLTAQMVGSLDIGLILKARSRLQQIKEEERQRADSQPRAISWEESHRQIVSQLGYDPT